MSEKFLSHISNLLQTDPICIEVPTHSNNKKIKGILKESEERIRFIEKFSETKKVSAFLPLLQEKLNTLKTSADRFENFYNELDNLTKKRKQIKETTEKYQKDETNVKKLNDNLGEQINKMKDQFSQLERSLNDQALAYATEKQSDLDKEFAKCSQLINDRQISIKENELLKEKRGSILSGVETQAQLMDKDYEDKKTEIENSKLKNLTNFEIYKQELNRKEDYEKEVSEAKIFCSKIETNLSLLESTVSDYEKLFNNSIKDFEKPLKKVEKIKKENTLLRKKNEEIAQNCSQNNGSIISLVEQQINLRAKIEKEIKQQATLHKLVESLETKLTSIAPITN